MIAAGNKTVIAVAGFVLLAISFIAAFTAQPVLLFLPAALLVGFCFIQFPEILFYVLLAAIPWSYEYGVTGSLSTDLPDEPLMLAAAFMAIALFEQQKTKSIGDKKIHPLLFILFVQMAWLAVTVILSSHPLLSIKYFVSKGWYLLAFAGLPLLLYGDEKLVRRSAIILFTSMFLITCVVFYRHAQMGFTFAKVNGALKPFFRNHVNYSALLVCMVPLQIAFLQLTKNSFIRFLLYASLFIVIPALYLSYSRGAWLALLMGLSAYWLIKKKWLVKSFILLILLCLVSVLWLKSSDRYLQFAPNYNTTFFHEDFSEHWAATYKGKDISTVERFYRWVAGVRMIEDSWQTGFGPATFYEHYKSYTIPLYKTWVSANKEHSTVHNYFLLLLIEQGAIGLLLFLVLVGALFWYAQEIYNRTDNKFWKITVAAVAAILLMQCTVNFLSDLIETDKVGSVFYLCVAVLVIADRKTREQ